MKIKFIKEIFIIALIFVMVGCSSQSQDSGENSGGSDQVGKELRVAIPASPPGLDSHVSASQNIADVGRHVFETLVTIDSNFNVKPMLAESWSESEDGKTITFNLRKGILFHNGKEMVADDIVASLERWFEVSSLGSENFSDASLEAKDDYTVELKLPTPQSTALSTLAYGGGNYASIMPKEIIESAGDEAVKEYVGTGPFNFEEWKQDQYIHLVKFDDYQPIEEQADGLAGKKEALVEGIHFLIVPDSSTRVAGIQTGEYDIAIDVNYDSVDQLKSNPDVELSNNPYGIYNIFYNKSNGIFKDIRAREAVALALDKKGLLLAAFSSEENYLFDHSMMMNYQAGLWSSDAGKEEYYLEPDIEKAKKLLEEAGYNGEEITILTSKDQDFLYNGSIVLQQQLEKLGLNAKVDVYDWPTYLDKRSEKTGFDILLGTSTPKLDPTSMAFLREDFVGWTDSPELPGLIKEFKTAPSLEEAKLIFNDLQEWFYEYKPVTKVGDFSKIHAVRSNVSGYKYLDGPIIWNVSNNQ